MRLASFEKKFIRQVYDNKPATRRAYLSVARKNGKTSLIAGILLAHLVGPEAKLNSQIVSGARSRDQASQVYNYAAKMLQLSPKLQGLASIVPSSKRIIGIAKNVEYRALAADGTTAHGLSPILAILDEIGQVRGPQDDFVDAITTSQGAHATPLLLAISTQAPTDGDLFSIWLDDAVRSGDPRIVCHLYTAPSDCSVKDRKAWKAANPALGLFRSVEDVKEQAERAARMPSEENTFRNLVLNQRVQLESPFISRSVWDSCSTEPDRELALDGQILAGLDLSARLDLTAFVVAALVGEKWHVFPYFWTPKDTLLEREKRDRVPYSVWVDQGFIRAIPGKAIDLEVVAQDAKDICEELRPAKIAYDRWRIDVMKKEFERVAFDIPLEPFGQGMKDMSPAIDTLEAALLNANIAHGGNPVLTMCAAQARIQRDAAGGRKLTKINGTSRIDGLVALAMAIGCVSKAEASGPSVYESRGLLAV